MTARDATATKHFGTASAALGALLIGALVLVFSEHLAAQQTTVRDALQIQVEINGTYVRRKSVFEEEEAARAAAIASAIAKVEPSVRRRWRAVIELSSLPDPRIQIANTATQIAIQEGDRPALVSEASGNERELSEKHGVRQQVENGQLVQRISSSALSGLGTLSSPLRTVSRHEMSRDRHSLSVTTEISGGDLATSIVFRTTYDRVDDGASRARP